MTDRKAAVDRGYMARALRLAERGRYTTDPNPRVGCVIVRDDEVVGEGWHRKAGEAHAERLALAAAADRARGATVYVTLEPCSHHGRTPPCAEALVEAAVGRVVVAMTDPNPLVAGQGIARLSDAGIETEVGLHILLCEKIKPGKRTSFSKAAPQIRTLLEERRRRNCQKAWLAELQRSQT